MRGKKLAAYGLNVPKVLACRTRAGTRSTLVERRTRARCGFRSNFFKAADLCEPSRRFLNRFVSHPELARHGQRGTTDELAPFGDHIQPDALRGR